MERYRGQLPPFRHDKGSASHNLPRITFDHQQHESWPNAAMQTSWSSNVSSSDQGSTDKNSYLKTCMCKRFMAGYCTYGDHCHYAHSVKELRLVPPPQVCERQQQQQHQPQPQNSSWRIQVCWRFNTQDGCRYGTSCRYLHVKLDKSVLGESIDQRQTEAIDVKRSGTSSHSHGNIKPAYSEEKNYELMQRNEFWKTKLCQKWLETGSCAYGDSCLYAHGRSEQKKIANMNAKASSSAAAAKKFRALDDSHLEAGCLGKNASVWKGKKKIKGIYGDWIADEEQHEHEKDE